LSAQSRNSTLIGLRLNILLAASGITGGVLGHQPARGPVT